MLDTCVDICLASAGTVPLWTGQCGFHAYSIGWRSRPTHLCNMLILKTIKPRYVPVCQGAGRTSWPFVWAAWPPRRWQIAPPTPREGRVFESRQEVKAAVHHGNDVPDQDMLPRHSPTAWAHGSRGSRPGNSGGTPRASDCSELRRDDRADPRILPLL